MAVAEPEAAPPITKPPVQATFWERVVAFLVDYQIVSLIVQIFTLPNLIAQGSRLPRTTVPSPPTLDFSGFGLSLVLFALYYVFFWSGRGGGRTWGMRVMGLRVAREDGSSLSVTRSFIRFGGFLLSVIPGYLGLIWAGIDVKKQGWHDKFAGSVVVGVEPSTYPPHPVNVRIAPPVSPNRFWALPVIGIVVKFFAVLPIFIAQFFAIVGGLLAVLVAWIPVLLVGRYPGWAFIYLRGLMRWSLRTSAFMYGLTDRYPLPGAGSDDPVALDIELPPSSSRLWAVPLLSFVVKILALIPVLLLTFLASQGLGAILLITWVPVLSDGTYPVWAHRFAQATLRWSARTQAFLLGFSDIYPDPWNWER